MVRKGLAYRQSFWVGLMVLGGAASSVLAPVRASAADAPAAKTTATGVKLVDYTVRSGETCHGIARRLYGDARRTVLIHRHNPQLGKSPHHLEAGQVLRVPERDDAQTESEPDARLTFLRNQVEAYTPEYHVGRLQEPLLTGNRVGTLARSAAEITFLDETQMQLQEHSLLAILGSSSERSRLSQRDRSKAAGGEQASLLKGSLRAFLAQEQGPTPPASPPGPAAKPAAPATVSGGAAERGLRLATPGASLRTESGAGELRVSVDESKTTRLAVYRGRSQLSAKGRSVDVGAGFGSKAELGKAPTPPRPLPDVPVIVEGPTSLLLTLGEPVALRLRYGAGPQRDPAPVRWHRQLGRDPRLNDVILDETVAVEQTAMSSEPLATGVYHVRISGIDADQFEGTARTFELRVAAVQHVAATADKPAQVTVPPELLCGLDDEPLRKHTAALAIPPERPHTLRCAVREGAAADQIAALPLPHTEPSKPAPKAEPPRPVRLGLTLASEPAQRTGDRMEQEIVLYTLDQDGVAATVKPGEVTVTAEPHVKSSPWRVIRPGELRTILSWPAKKEGGAVRITVSASSRALNLILGGGEARVGPNQKASE